MKKLILLILLLIPMAISSQTIFKKGVVYYINGIKFIEDTTSYITDDTSYYHTTEMITPQITYMNLPNQNMGGNLNDYVVSKVGGVLIRSDNWLGNSDNLTQNMQSLQNWLQVFDKYNIKVLLALNERYSTTWTKEYKEFWRSVQARGHEIADHGPEHTNFTYPVVSANRIVTTNTPGVEAIATGSYDRVYADTIEDGANDLLSHDGFDIMLKRSQRMFKEEIGLNPFTYWIEGGGQSVYYNSDSLGASWKNGVIAGGKYNNQKYKHMGFSPPAGWVGKSEFFMDWNDTENAITLDDGGTGTGDRDYSAASAIKKIVDNSAKHGLTIFRQHIATANPVNWFLNCYDSILQFIVTNPHYIRTGTGSQWGRRMYQSQTNVYENTIPHNPITNQVFEDNIDAIYGDTDPDGWNWTGSHDSTAWVYDGGGSQGSYGYCIVVPYAWANALRCGKLYGIEKGDNIISIDTKDRYNSDSVDVTITQWYGDDFLSLSTSATSFRFPSQTEWTTHQDTITINRNTTYIRIDINADPFSGTVYVDEITLRKK